MAEEATEATEAVEEEAPAPSPKLAEIIDAIGGLTVLELAELVKALEDKFGVSAAAPIMPGSILISSNSPIGVSGRTVWIAARRLSSSIARAKPPASRTAACSNDMIWRPC